MMKNLSINNLKNLAIIILVIALFISFQQCNQEKEIRQNNLSSMNDSIKFYKNKLGTISAEKKVQQLTKEDFEKYILENDKKLAALTKEFSKVKHLVVIQEKIQIDSIKIPFSEPAPCVFEKSGDYENDWFNLGYKVNQNGLTIEPFNTWNEQTIITGFKKKWFLGKQYMTTDVTNSNPYIMNTDVKTIEVVVPKPFYDTRAFNIGIGFIGGALLSR